MRRQDLTSLSARAQEDAKRFFFFVGMSFPEPETTFNQAMSDFEVVPYPLRWYLYRSTFRKTLVSLKKEYVT